jgi:hypothetical protein
MVYNAVLNKKEHIMNLYLISQDVNDDYDTYDSAVVCADTGDEARMIHPGGGDDWDGEDEKYSSWCTAKNVLVEEIGIAHFGNCKGIICASFNAS